MTAKKGTLAFIFITILLDAMGIGVIIPVLPKLITTFEGGDASTAAKTYGYLTALYAGMIFLFGPLLGALSDKFGRRPILLISLIGVCIDYIIMAYAPNLTWLVIGRLLAGLFGASITTAQAYIADVTVPEKRAQAFGMVGAAFGAGFILGPAVGGLLATIGLRAPFFGAAALAGLNALYGLFILPESLPKENRRSINLRQANPLGVISHLKQYKGILGLVLIYVMIVLSGQVMPSVWVFFTTLRFGWTEVQIGLSLAFVGVLIGVVQGGLTRVLIPKLGTDRSIIYGLCLASISLVLISFTYEGWMMYALMPIYALSGIAGPALQGLVSVQVPNNEQGQLQGGLTGITGIIAALAPIVYTNVFSAFTKDSTKLFYPGSAFMLSAFFGVIAIIVAIYALPKVPKKPNPGEDIPLLDLEMSNN